MIAYMIAVFCVLGLAIGQVLFKASATNLSQSGSFFEFKTAAMLLAAMCLYGVTSVAWVWVLQKVELGRAYPLMALGFVLVPLASYLIFGEKFTAQYFLGVVLIVTGIVVTLNS